MKIRTGFVSNSSSSSFVAVGFKITHEEYCQKIDETGAIYNNAVYLEDGYIVGEVLANDEFMDCNDISPTKIEALTLEVADKYKVDKELIRLYFGTRPS